MSDDTTRIIRRKTVGETETTAPSADPDKTRIIRRATVPGETKSAPTPQDDVTRLHGAPKRSEAASATEQESPVVGWLVVMDGPGRGRSLTLGYGMNHVGRGDSNRVRLDFGDEEISRKTHSTVTYDPRGRKFYIQPGPDATNLTYLGDEPQLRPVLTPTELAGGESITLGQTRLKFVAFCGADFAWE